MRHVEKLQQVLLEREIAKSQLSTASSLPLVVVTGYASIAGASIGTHGQRGAAEGAFL